MDSAVTVKSMLPIPALKARNMLQSPDLSSQPYNFSIIVGDEKIPVHRQWLQDVSDYFYCLFDSRMQETEKATLELKDTKTSVVKTVIAYICGKVINIELEDIMDYVDIVEMWQILSLKDKLEMYIIKYFDRSNCFHFWIMAQTYGMKKLATGTERFVARKFEDISSTSDFTALDLVDLKHLFNEVVKTADHNVMVKFRACINWIPG